MSSSGSLGCKARVLVVVRVAGLHNWPEAPAAPGGYLRHPHRHLFTVRVEWPVTHSDRDVEFHTAQRWVLRALGCGDATFVLEFGAKSCEMIARHVLERLIADGHPRPMAAEVWEDDENGARVDLPGVDAPFSEPVRLLDTKAEQ